MAFLLVPIVYWRIIRTAFGLNGELSAKNHQAADTFGVSVYGVRTVAIIFGIVMAGIAGAALTLEIGIFQRNLTAGHGLVAIALIYFGASGPVGVMTGFLLFGIVSSTVFQLQVQVVISRSVSSIANMAPAALTALVVVGWHTGQPAPFTGSSR